MTVAGGVLSRLRLSITGVIASSESGALRAAPDMKVVGEKAIRRRNAIIALPVCRCHLAVVRRIAVPARCESNAQCGYQRRERRALLPEFDQRWTSTICARSRRGEPLAQVRAATRFRQKNALTGREFALRYHFAP